MQAPGSARLECRMLGFEVLLRDFRQEPHRHDGLGEYVVNQSFGFDVGEVLPLQTVNLVCEAPKVLLEPDDCERQLLLEMQAGGVLAAQGDKIATEDEIVADEYGKAGA